MNPIDEEDFKHFAPNHGSQGIKRPVYNPLTGQTEWVTQIDYDEPDKSCSCVVCRDFGYVNVQTPTEDGHYQDFSYRCYCAAGDKACLDVRQISKLHYSKLNRRKLAGLP